MKQTAVEWLVEQIIKEKGLVDLDIQAAKEMEKEQMRLADKNGQDRNQYKHDCKYGGVEYWDNEPKPFEEYYNETYGGNK
jgi:hypothetical protein